MKKILLSLSTLALLGTTTLNAELLMGVEYNVMSSMTGTETYETGGSSEYDFTYQPIKFKVGFGSPESIYLYGYFQSAEQEYDAGGSSESISEFGLDLVVQMDVGVKHVKPFIEIGAGAGRYVPENIIVDEDGYYDDDNEIFSVILKAGAGVSYYVTPKIELLAGVEYKYASWDDSMYNNMATKEDTGVNVFVGINLWPFAVDPEVEAAKAAQREADEYNQAIGIY